MCDSARLKTSCPKLPYKSKYNSLLIKPYEYYQNTKFVKPDTSPEELNNFSLYVDHETSTVQCDLGINKAEKGFGLLV